MIKKIVTDGMFGVFSPLGEKLGVSNSRIRLFFIYISFLTFGSPVFLYLAAAFIININRYINDRKRNPVWEF